MRQLALAAALFSAIAMADTQPETIAQPSSNNSTTVALGAAGTFTGAADDLTTYSGMVINVAGTPAGANGTFTFQFSADGTNWDVSIPVAVSDLTTAVPFPLISVLRYFRLLYTNGATPQSTFRLTTTLMRRYAGTLVRLPTQVLTAQEPVTVVRALIEPAQIAANKIPGNVAQVNGVTVNVGTGAASTGTQRVAVASDSSITANAGTNLNTSALALDATLTSRAQKAQVTDGTRDGTVKAASTAAIAADTALVVAVSPNNSVAVTAAALPLPAGAATAAKQPALGTAGSASADVISVQGVASMTALKVDGSGFTQPVSGTVTANAGSGTMAVSAASLPLPSGAATSALQTTGNTSLGNLDVLLSTRTKPADQQHVIVDTTVTVSGTVTANAGSGTLAVSGPLTDAQLRASAVPVSLATAPTTPVTGTFFQTTQPVSTPDGGTQWAMSLPDAGAPASDDAVQRSATDLMAIRQLLEQLVLLQQQSTSSLAALKDPGR